MQRPIHYATARLSACAVRVAVGYAPGTVTRGSPHPGGRDPPGGGGGRPARGHDGVSDLLQRFEDRDEPVTAEADVEEEIAEAKGAVDPQDEDPEVVMMAAVATYLAFRRTEIERDREELLRLAARAEFEGQPAPLVADWLAAQGVEV